jgi:Tfp pilus assembly protein PilE
MLHRQKGQTALEYMVLIIIVVGALLAIQNYFKRSLQGRWKAAMDDMGDQYDPRAANSTVRHTLVQSTNTSIVPVLINPLDPDSSYWTMRTDDSISTERKQGTVSAGAY